MRRIAMHTLARIFRERKRQTFISAWPRVGGDPLGRRTRNDLARPAHTGLKSEPGNPRSHPDQEASFFHFREIRATRGEADSARLPHLNRALPRDSRSNLTEDREIQGRIFKDLKSTLKT